MNIESSALSKHSETTDNGTIERVKQILEQIDVQAIKALFEKIVVLTQENHTEDDAFLLEGFIDMSHVHVHTNAEKSFGGYRIEHIDINAGQLDLYANAIAEYVTRNEDLSPEEKEKLTHTYLEILTHQTLVHEELHAITDYNWELEDADGNTTMSRRVGFQNISEESHGAVNEGVTELFANHLVRQYFLQYSPGSISRKAVSLIFDEIAQIAYQKEQWVVEQYIALLAAVAGVSEETVEMGLYGSYLRNGAVIPMELAETIAESSAANPKLYLVVVKIAFLEDLLENNTFDSQEATELFNELASDYLEQEEQVQFKNRMDELEKKYNRTLGFLEFSDNHKLVNTNDRQ